MSLISLSRILEPFLGLYLVAQLSLCVSAWGDCPKSPGEWESFKTQLSRSLFEIQSFDGTYNLDLDESICLYKKVKSPDSDDFTFERDYPKCMEHLVEYANQFQRLQSSPPDSIPLVPSELNNTGFLNGLSKLNLNDSEAVDGFLEQKLREMNASRAEDRKIRAVPFTSPHLALKQSEGGKSEQFRGRIVFQIPHQRGQYLASFTVRSEDNTITPSNLSLITSVDRNPDGTTVDRPTLYFSSHNRSNGKIEKITTDERCDSCHKSGFFPISAKSGSLRERWQSDLKAINKMMNSQRPVIAGLNKEILGPGIGPVNSELRTPEFIKSCSGFTDPAVVKKIRNAMACEKCHHEGSRGKLSMPMFPLSDGKLLFAHFIETTETMPPGAKLTQEERVALSKCLKSEYHRGFEGKPGLLAQWLLEPSCLPVPSAEKSSAEKSAIDTVFPPHSAGEFKAPARTSISDRLNSEKRLSSPPGSHPVGGSRAHDGK